MKIYLVLMEKDSNDYDGSVVFTHRDKKKAIEFAMHLRSVDPRNPFWVDEWPMESTMTYQNVKTVYAVG